MALLGAPRIESSESLQRIFHIIHITTRLVVMCFQPIQDPRHVLRRRHDLVLKDGERNFDQVLCRSKELVLVHIATVV